MATCRVCTAPITWGRTVTGEKIPLDDHEQQDEGPQRYRIIQDGTNPTVELVAENNPARTYVDHRALCGQPRAI